MTTHSEDNKEVRDYLLGILAEENQRLIEERLLTESGFLEELLISEEELIDDYVNDELSADSRLKFEQHFLCTPQRRQKLRFAFALGRYASQTPVPAISPHQKNEPEVVPSVPNWVDRFGALWLRQKLAFRFAIVFASIVVVVATVWLLRPRTFTPKTFATVTLSISSGNRADGPAITRVKLPQAVDALKIFLKLPDVSGTAHGYRVELIDDQRVTKTLEIAGQDAQSLTVIIIAGELARGNYALHLYSTNSDGSEKRINGNYYFTVE